MASKDPQLNPDYVRFQNDKKQKRLTKRHLAQRIANQKKWIEQEERWQDRGLKRILELKCKLIAMEVEYKVLG